MYSRHGFKRAAAAAGAIPALSEPSRSLRSARLQIRQDRNINSIQVADLRRDLGGSIDSRTLYGLSINIMRFDYDFSFAGNPAIDTISRWGRSRTCRSLFMTVRTALRFA